MHEGTLLHKETFARVDFFIFFVSFSFSFIFIHTITVTPNSYLRSVAFFFLFFINLPFCFILLYIYIFLTFFYSCVKVTQLSLGANLTDYPFKHSKKNFLVVFSFFICLYLIVILSTSNFLTVKSNRSFIFQKILVEYHFC